MLKANSFCFPKDMDCFIRVRARVRVYVGLNLGLGKRLKTDC